MDKLKIGVFCSSRDLSVTMYEEAAVFLMAVLYEIGVRNIVYGGGKKGLMGVVYREAMVHKMNIVGHNLEKWSTPDLDNEILYNNLTERQNGLIDACDVFIALPGGIGTLYEIMQVLCHNDVLQVKKPVFLYNYHSFFNSTIQTLHELSHKGMIDSNLCLALINNNEDLVRIMVEYVYSLGLQK